MMHRTAVLLAGMALAMAATVQAGDPATQPATPAPAAALAPAAAPGALPLMYTNRVPHEKPKPGEVRAMTVKELGNFDYDPDKGGPVPPDVQVMSGMKVRISGFMMPLDQSGDNITEFALVPSLTNCCFGQPPGVQHIITVHCPKDKPAQFAIDPVIVEGTLKVEIQREDDYTVSIFEIYDATVKPIQLNLTKEVLQGTTVYVPKVDVKN